MFLILSFLIVLLNPVTGSVSGIQVLELFIPAWFAPATSISACPYPSLYGGQVNRPVSLGSSRSLPVSLEPRPGQCVGYEWTIQQPPHPLPKLSVRIFSTLCDVILMAKQPWGTIKIGCFGGILWTIKFSYWVGYFIACGILWPVEWEYDRLGCDNYVNETSIARS